MSSRSGRTSPYGCVLYVTCHKAPCATLHTGETCVSARAGGAHEGRVGQKEGVHGEPASRDDAAPGSAWPSPAPSPSSASASTPSPRPPSPRTSTWTATPTRSSSTSGTIVVALADGAGGFLRTARPTRRASTRSPLEVADLDGDGFPDLVVTSRRSPQARCPILLGVVTRRADIPSASPLLPVEFVPEHLSVTDVDEDGTLDIVLAASGRVAWCSSAPATGPSRRRRTPRGPSVLRTDLRGAGARFPRPQATRASAPSTLRSPPTSSMAAALSPPSVRSPSGSSETERPRPSWWLIGTVTAIDDVLTIDDDLDTVGLYRGQNGALVYDGPVATLDNPSRLRLRWRFWPGTSTATRGRTCSW